MSRITARAPGKIFLLGEYAVLDGAPAIVAAVDRVVEVQLTRRRTEIVQITASGHGDSIAFPAGRPPQHAPLRFALSAYAHAIAAWPHLANNGYDLVIRSDGLDGSWRTDTGAAAETARDRDLGHKTGLGSSAAVTVALTAALAAAAGTEATPAAFRAAVCAAASVAHRAAQHGLGSGADVAASTYGGVIRFEPRSHALPRTTQLTLPSATMLLIGWTGAGSATAPLVHRYHQLDQRVRAPFVRVTRGAVEWFSSALQRGAVSLAAVDAAATALEQLAGAAEMPLLNARLRQMIAIARAHGAAAKPSGAGGGDCGIAFTANPTAAERIRDAWRVAGLLPLDVHLSRDGVVVAAA